MDLFSTALPIITKLFYLLIALAGFGALITVHEFGHFIFCKLFLIKTPTFSIGMGPVLYKKKFGETEFCLSAIPLGGYVEIAGLAEPGQGEQQHAQDQSSQSFNRKPYWQQALVLLGGIMFNLIFAYFCFFALFTTGMSIPNKIDHLKITHFVPDSPGQKQGFKEGDLITSINGQKISEKGAEGAYFFFQTVRSSADKEIKVSIIREEKELELAITPAPKKMGAEEVGFVGTATTLEGIEYTIERFSIGASIPKAAEAVWHQSKAIALSIYTMISERSLSGAGGPVRIISETFKSAERGFSHLLLFLAIISINLALLNLLPLGALDGGQLLFSTIEAIIGGPVPLIVRGVVNIGSWILFLGLFVFLTYHDILALVFGK